MRSGDVSALTGGREFGLGWRLARPVREGWRRALGWCLVGVLCCGAIGAQAMPLSSQARSRLASGQATLVIVEVDSTATDRAADAERARRHLTHDDAAILAMRSRGYAASKAAVAAGVAGRDATRVRDYTHFPLAVWRLSSIDALSRLEAYPEVRVVHQNISLRPVSVSDLPFINQPQAAAEGATGAGTTIAVIDGGLVSNFTAYSDFGTCTGVGTPATCRVVFNQDDYSGSQASTETTHGTNVSAIALGVAPGAKLAMFNVFEGASASSGDIIAALDAIIDDRATYNIVAVNLSLGDGTSNSSQCGSSVFAEPLAATLSAGVQPVIAAGNNGSKTGLSDPACVSGVISVGAVYDASYGTVTWETSVDPVGTCTDASAADHVTCFSQSASYLSMLAPGTFVNAPTSAFQQSGTSQATPHISGSVAVLHARYPAETFSETLQRMQLSGVSDTDSANGRATPRLNLQAAVNLCTVVALSGSGPTQAVSGQKGTYSITVTNSGPIAATNVSVNDTLPAFATLTSASSGCTLNTSSSTVNCSIGTLAAGASITLTLTVTWTGNGSVYDAAVVKTDQINSSTQGVIQFGTPPAPQQVMSGDAPLPLWAYALLGVAFVGLASRRLRDGVADRS
jgi:uncharacterized repeat protein (TIGR01451 family)